MLYISYRSRFNALKRLSFSGSILKNGPRCEQFCHYPTAPLVLRLRGADQSSLLGGGEDEIRWPRSSPKTPFSPCPWMASRTSFGTLALRSASFLDAGSRQANAVPKQRTTIAALGRLPKRANQPAEFGAWSVTASPVEEICPAESIDRAWLFRSSVVSGPLPSSSMGLR